MFNSEEYGWVDVEIFLLGKRVAGARGISYDVEQEKEAIYASGNNPRGIGRGNKSYSGELVVLQSELQALENAAGAGNDIIDLRNMSLTVAYAPKEGGVISTDIITNMEFTKSSKGLKQNDKFSEHTLPFIALGIQKGV